jgi:hypothetical protein
MIEFWAAVGLACTDLSFLKAVQNPEIIKQSSVQEVLKEYGIRLSYFELSEFKRFIGNSEIVTHMTAIYALGCPKPMHCFACVKHMVSPGYMERYEAIHQALIAFMRELPEPPDSRDPDIPL